MIPRFIEIFLVEISKLECDMQYHTQAIETEKRYQFFINFTVRMKLYLPM